MCGLFVGVTSNGAFRVVTQVELVKSISRANVGLRHGAAYALAATKMKAKREPIRWAVVGLGHFAQTAILPAFAARGAGVVAALVTDDPKKAATLARLHDVKHVVDYDNMEAMFSDARIDAAYVVVPNHRHCELAVRALRSGVHVLCEKPMAVTEEECKRMAATAKQTRRKLMIGYRLHLEAANMTTVDRLRKGEIGDVRYFSASFSFKIAAGNVRTVSEVMGGGVLYDIGVYCINAARYFLGAEPTRVMALAASRPKDKRFRNGHEQFCVGMEFPQGRMANFTVSFGGASMDQCVVVGSEGSIKLEPAFTHSQAIEVTTTSKTGTQRTKTYPLRDQVAAELVYFSRCIQENRLPEPSAEEGRRDVVIVRALLKSVRTGKAVEVKISPKPKQRPSGRQVVERKASKRKPPLVRAKEPKAQK